MAKAWRKLKKALSSLKQQPKPVPSVDNSHSKSPAIPPSSSSSSLSHFSRSFTFTTTTRSSNRTCAICLGSMKAGNGPAIFTAECSHAFHFSCIGNSVKHGNRLCPMCRCKWKEIPLQFPTFSTDVNGMNAGGSRVSPYHVALEDPVRGHIFIR